MRVLTIKSAGILDEDMQTEVHHGFRMEHHTDYVFKPRGDQKYSATIVLDNTEPVIKQVISASSAFPDLAFVIEENEWKGRKKIQLRLKDLR